METNLQEERNQQGMGLVVMEEDWVHRHIGYPDN